MRSEREIRKMIAWSDTLALGPGIGTHHETVELVKRLVLQTEKPMIIDADGLNCLAKNAAIIKQHKNELVISPHIGEFSRLTGLAIEEIIKNRFKYAVDFAAENNLTIILKGAPSIIADAAGNIHINSTGNEGMATAGSGDVLTGLVGGFLAQGMKTVEAAVLAVYAHGLAGDMAAETVGSRGMIAGDILDYVPKALLNIEGLDDFDDDYEDYPDYNFDGDDKLFDLN